MTILAACKTAALRLTRTDYVSVFTATDTFARELVDLANDVAAGIVKANEWQALRTEGGVTGDGVSTAFAVPSDLDRLVTDAKLTLADGTQYNTTYTPDQLTRDRVTGSERGWFFNGDQVQVFPALAFGTTARFWYVSKNFANGKTASLFTADSDTFFLPDRLLALGIIWQWRALKRLEYAEDMQNYEIALSQAMAGDGPRNILRVGRLPASSIPVAIGGTSSGSSGLPTYVDGGIY